MTYQTEPLVDLAGPVVAHAILYSGTTGAFYDTASWPHELPSDAVEVSAEEHAAQLAAEANGSRRASDEAGRPIHVDPLPPTIEELAARARSRRDHEVASIQWLIERHRGELALQLTTTLTNEDYLLVLQHAQDLRDVPEQESFPTEIDWPILPPELLTTGA